MLHFSRHFAQPVAMISTGVLLTGALLVGGGRLVTAQESDAHPIHIHTGSCAALGEVAFPLTDLDSPGEGAEATGSTSAVPVDVSVTTIQTDLKTINDGAHAINVHESKDNIDTYIACGDIGGVVTGTDLALGLNELNRSGYQGVASLHDNGDGTTTVQVFLTEAHEEVTANAEGTPVVVTGTGVAVSLADFTIVPETTTFKVGETYTFVVTNHGVLSHEVVLEPAGAADEPMFDASGKESEVENVEPGETDTLTWTFTKPGRYQMACHVPGHVEQGMVVEIEVTE